MSAEFFIDPWNPAEFFIDPWNRIANHRIPNVFFLCSMQDK